MTNEALTDEWLEQITAHNPNAEIWNARFSIDGRQLIEAAVKALDRAGGTIGSNGSAQEYVVRFPATAAREITRIMVEQGGVLCADQALAPVP